MQIPILSLNLLESEPAEFAQRLGDSFQKYRLVILTDHPIGQELLDRKLQADQKVFALPNIHEYRSFGIDQSGYFQEGKEYASSSRAPDRKRMWQIYREFPHDHELRKQYPENVWPTEVPEFKTVSMELYSSFDKLAKKLLGSIEHFLGVETGFLADRVENGKSVLRTNYYPTADELRGEEFGEERGNPHSDINYLTMMPAPEVSGYQLRDGEGNWHTIDAPSGSLIVNTGKKMAAITNAALKPAWHRVQNIATDQPRFSIPFFVHARDEVKLEPHPKFVGEQFPEPLPGMSDQEFRDAVKQPGIVREWIKALG